MLRAPLLTLPLLALLLLLLLPACCSGEGRQHYKAGEDGERQHDAGYDSEKFLGKEQAKEFGDLDEKQAIDRLRQLVEEQVDLDKDGYVSMEELIKHLEKVQQRSIEKDVEQNWSEQNATGGQLDWGSYARSLHASLFEDESRPVQELAAKAVEAAAKADGAKIDVEIPPTLPSEEQATLKDYFAELLKHRRRWLAADANSDGQISKAEYWSLLMPDEMPNMREVVAQETMESLDKDGDGRISRREMVDDLWKQRDGEKEPEWLDEERREFDTKKDTNGDGYLDGEELRKWQQDSAKDSSAKAEAEHLVQEADTDKDGRLSLDEVAAAHELFAGSQATNYGSDIGGGREHDEL